MSKSDSKNNQPKSSDDSNEVTPQAHTEAHNQTSVHIDSISEAHATSSTNELDGRLDDLTQDLKRVQAEFLNYKRRAEQERGEASELAKTRVVREFLSVRDSFDQELLHRPSDVDAKWAASIDSIRGQFDKALKSLSVERFESVGQKFDPHRHEAIAVEDGEGQHEVVTDELQAGYQLGATVLRHAMVKVGHSDE